MDNSDDISLPLPTLNDYANLSKSIATIQDPEELRNLLRYLARHDVFFLGWYICNRTDMFNQWVLDRCREVQKEPDGCIDLWARAHMKSSIITQLKTIQDILISHGNDPKPICGEIEPTFGIFSYARPTATAFLKQIKNELTQNEVLIELFPDILYQEGEVKKNWSDKGITVKRKSTEKECTVEAWGVVDGQPTSKHFTVLIYDDMVTVDTVTSEYMIKKAMDAWRVSVNLGKENSAMRIIGTRYHFNDPYQQMIDSKIAKVRIYPATHDGTKDGEPVLISKEELKKKYKQMGTYVFSAQMLLNPVDDAEQVFKQDWIQFYDEIDYQRLNRYIIVDPANDKKKTSDYTAMITIGLGEDGCYYVLHILRDRLNLNERIDWLFTLHKRFKPHAVGYEQYGLQTDVFHIKERQKSQNYRFKMVELKGQMSKKDRILRLVPPFENHQLLLPQSCFHKNHENITENLVDSFVHHELLQFPYSKHDDMLDAMSRIMDPDMKLIWPDSVQSAKIRAYYNSCRSDTKWGS